MLDINSKSQPLDAPTSGGFSFHPSLFQEVNKLIKKFRKQLHNLFNHLDEVFVEKLLLQR